MNLLENNLSLKLTRSIETAILGFLVLHNYAVDRNAYLDNPAGYNAKQLDIRSRKGFCVEVLGHGAPADRDFKDVPRMVITSLGFLPGTMGNDGQEYYKENAQGKYDKIVGPSRSSHFRFDLELASNKAMQDAVLETTRSNALMNLSQIPVYDSPSESFLLEYMQHRNSPDLGNGIIQRVYTYQILDVFETLPIVVSSEIAKIKSITIKDADDGSTILKVPK